jgi:hypothetical protein
MKSRSICLMLAVVAVAALSVSNAIAQPGGGRGFGGFGAPDPATLLGQESVQKELELSADQKTQVTKFSEEAREARRGMFQPGGDPQEMQKKLADMAAANKKKVAELLLPPQNARLDEIALQYGVYSAALTTIGQDATAEKLGLTADQKKKVTDLIAENGTKAREIFQDAQGDFQGAQAKIREAQKTAAMGVLTAEQKEKLEKLQGKKFDVAGIQLFRPRGNQ